MKVFVSIKDFFRKLGNKIAGCFRNAKESIMSHKLSTLVVMQLKDKWNFSLKNKKETFFKLIAYLLLFAVFTALMYLVMNLSVTKLHIFFSSKIPVAAMTVLIFVITIFEGISILIGLTKSLYFSKDNVVLITYPVKADYLFVSKLIVYYLDALKKSCVLLLPALVAFGIIYSYGFYYYIWILLLLLIFVMFIVVVCAILSIPTYFIMKFLNKYRIFKILFAVLVLGVVIFGVIKLIGVIPENINLIKTYATFANDVNDFLKWFNSNFFVSSSITAMFCGVKSGPVTRLFSWNSLIVPVCLIAATALLVFANMMVSKPFYTKMISAASHNTKPKSSEKKNVEKGRLVSVVRYELLRIVRDEKQVVSSIISIVVMPLIILLFNRVYKSIDLSNFGILLTSMFNYFFVMVVVTSHNISTSYIYSKDGPSWNINKTIPIDPRASLLSRLVYNTIISVLIIVPACVMYSTYIDQITVKSAIFIIVSMILLTMLHSLLSASFDYSHSENKDKADIGSEIIGKHEAISLLFGFAISLGVTVFIYILNNTTTSNNSLVQSERVYLRVMILSILLVAYEAFMFTRKIKATFQEN